MSYSELTKECIRSLQDKRAVHLGTYQVQLDKACMMLETFCGDPIPGYERTWSHQRQKLKAFWKTERERAWIASLKLREQEGMIQPYEKRPREDDGTDCVTSFKRHQVSSSTPVVLQPACIQRDYRRHEPAPLFPPMADKKGKRPASRSEKGSLEMMRLTRSWKHIQNERPMLLWKEKVETLCKLTPKADIARIRAELPESRGRIRKPPPRNPPGLCWRTDNKIFAEIKRKEKQGMYYSLPPELAGKDELPEIRRVPSIHQTSQSPEPQSWIELDTRDTKRLTVLRTKLAGCEWPDLSAIDSYIDDGSPDTHDNESAQISQVSPYSVDSVTDWITRKPRAKVSLNDAMWYCQRRVEVAECFSKECTRYLHTRVHKELAFNLDLLSSTETFLGFSCARSRDRK